jgi:hypothetical protein
MLASVVNIALNRRQRTEALMSDHHPPEPGLAETRHCGSFKELTVLTRPPNRIFAPKTVGFRGRSARASLTAGSESPM